MSLERIHELLAQLPSHSLVHGGSHAGKLYQNYPWPPLDTLPAHRHDTQQRLDWLLSKIGPVKGKTIRDVGCGNGALSIGLALHGAHVTGHTMDQAETLIAQTAEAMIGPDPMVLFTTYAPEPSMQYDIVLCLSVWKWIARRDGLRAADTTINWLAQECREQLIFESGLTDGGMDLGLPITKADIPRILREQTGCEPELLGIEPREDGSQREVWRCRRNA